MSWPENRYTIIFRLLEKAGFHAVRWLRENVGDDGIRDFIIQRRGRGIDPEWLRYWEPIVGLPHEQVEEWIATAMKSPWYNRLTGMKPLRADPEAD